METAGQIFGGMPWFLAVAGISLLVLAFGIWRRRRTSGEGEHAGALEYLLWAMGALMALAGLVFLASTGSRDGAGDEKPRELKEFSRETPGTEVRDFKR